MLNIFNQKHFSCLSLSLSSLCVSGIYILLYIACLCKLRWGDRPICLLSICRQCCAYQNCGTATASLSKTVYCAIGNRFRICSSRLYQCLDDVKQNPQLKLCAPLKIVFRIANYCTRWPCNFKGLSQDGGQANLRSGSHYSDTGRVQHFFSFWYRTHRMPESPAF